MADSSLSFDRPGLLSLCSGTGMLDIGVKLAFEQVFGRLPRVLGYAEREAYAAALLLARMEEQSLEPAPVFCGDFRDLDARPLRGHVGVFAAGLPCQPYSAAGKRKGLKDERSYGKGGDGPLPHAIRILSECAPALVCLENVPQWVTSGAFRRFGDSLAALGYEIEEPLFVRARDVGASHQRERVFILAHLPGQRRLWSLPAGPGPERQGTPHAERRGPAMAEHQSERGRPWAMPGGNGTEHAESGHASGPVGHAEGHGRGARGAESVLHSGRDAAAEPGGAVADAERGGLREQWWTRRESCDVAPEGEGMADAGGERWQSRSELGGLLGQADGAALGDSTPELCRPLFAPGPDAFEAWAHTLRNAPHLAPALESGVCLLADGLAFPLDASRPDQLRCGGNGVVALQAAAAFAHLFRRLKP